MGKFVAIAAILLALFTAACIAYIAWELTAGKERPDESEEPDRPDSD